MKKKLILFSMLLLITLIVAGCGSKVKIEGTELNFTKSFKNHYISYYYPEEFTLREKENEYDKNNVYDFYKDGKLEFVLKIEEHSLNLSFKPMEEDAQKIESDPNNKNLEHQTFKLKGKNIVRYSFKKDDEFGNDTLYYVYFGGYSYMGVREYIKITFINVEGREGFEKEFFKNFKIND